MKKLTKLAFMAVSIAGSASVFAQDQCNTTAECRATYGDRATDCRDSQSSQSVCMCSSERCDASSGGNGVLIPGVIQAEDYSNFFDTTPGNTGGQHRTDDVDIQVTTDANGGFNVGWIAGNEWLEFPINVSDAGRYKAEARVASAPGNGMFTIEVNGVSRSTFTVNSTGGWQSWNTITETIGQLNRGQNTLRVQVQAGNFNLNWIRVSKEGSAPSGMLGRFDIAKDMLLANFDGKPDADDIHSVAGLGTMLLDPRFNNVKVHAVAGAYGKQGGQFIPAGRLFNMAFDSSRWSDAHNNYNNALNQTAAKVIDTLRNGGDVWVQEAGQSDFTADIVRRVKQQLPNVNTRTRIHVVQHSQWNEDQTRTAALNYVKQNTQYNKIDDGNGGGNSTPGFHTHNGSQWNRAVSDPEAGALWREARKVANDSLGKTGYDNPAIKAGGFDFSDVVEDTWIFGFNGIRNGINGFFDEFL